MIDLLDEKNNENLDIKKEINEIKSAINSLTNKLNALNESVEKLKTHRGDRKVSKFEIKSKAEWDFVERTLLQKGFMLEYEIFKSLEKMGIEYEPNHSFPYPTGTGLFYIDTFFSNNNIFCHLNDAPDIKTSLFETDVWIKDSEIIQDENFIINLNINYFIECKSRSNPPINYLFVLDKKIPVIRKKGYPFILLRGSKFFNDLLLEIDFFWRTEHDPIQISYPKLNIEEKEALNTAFWQLFKRIDYSRNNDINLMFFNIFNNFDEVEIPNGLKLPRYISLFPEFYNRMKNDNLIPKKLNEKINIQVSIYVPIIVVNSNIYSIDLDPEIEKDFFDRVAKAPGFIKEFNYLKQGTYEGQRFTDLTRFVMMFLQQSGVCFRDDSFFPELYEPVLDIFVISSSEFSTYFEKIRNRIRNICVTEINAMKEGSLLKKKEELLRFQILQWMLYHSSSLKVDLINLLYEEYKHFKEKNLRLR